MSTLSCPAMDAAEFFNRVREFLVEQQSQNILQKFILNCTRAVDASSALINGTRYSKAPDQFVDVTETQVYIESAGNNATEFSFYGCLFEEFVREFYDAVNIGVPLEHSPLLKTRGRYPNVQLASPELLALGTKMLETSVSLAHATDKKAALITHPGLMSREVSGVISHSHRYYADSQANVASEQSSSVNIAVSYALSDTSEFYSDVFGTVPTNFDIQRVVDEASKNLKQYEIRPLAEDVSYSVLLTPKAVCDLFSDLIFPNLEMRTILDKTGRWDILDIGQTVLPNVSISDNPHINNSPFSSTFDNEGVPSKPVEIVKNGILSHPLVTSLLLEELVTINPQLAANLDQTGHADSSTSASFTNVSLNIEGQKFDSVEAMLKSTKNVVVISWLTGMSVDAVSGQFALDAEGAKVYENGVLKYSTSLTLRGNFFEALSQPRKIGPTERVYNVFAPTLMTDVLKCVSKGSPDEGNDESEKE